MFFAKPSAAPAHAWLGQLGSSYIAGQLTLAGKVPAHCFGLAALAAGDSRGDMHRLPVGSNIAAGGYLVHPGPYCVDILPQQNAPELALRLYLVLDSADPRLQRQRFELFLHSEAPSGLSLAELRQSVQACIDAQSQHLYLETCPSAQEWLAYRAALEKLLYIRFGWSVEDCMPVDLRGQANCVDYVDQVLACAAEARPQRIEAHTQTPIQTSAQKLPMPAAQLRRRLFLELPALCQAWRLLDWPQNLALFSQRQALWHRLDMLDAQLAILPDAAFHKPSLHQTLEQAWAQLAQWQALAAHELNAQHVAAIAALCDAWQADLISTAADSTART